MTFGKYKGQQMYLLHIAKDEFGNVQTPLFAPLREQAHWYPDLLACKVKEGYTSESLEIYSRDGFNIGRHYIHILNQFKQKVRSK
jgi:hypothetical protein